MTTPDPRHPENLDVPAAWRETLAGYHWEIQTIGCSEAAVFRLGARGRPALFVKTEPAGTFAELRDEIDRLHWLSGTGIPCPRIIADLATADRDWLLMTALQGDDLASSSLGPRQVVEIAADALRGLHGLDITGCPFDERLDRKIALALARFEAGLVDEEEFDEENRGQPTAVLAEKLAARRPRREALVVAHGDACLPNMIAENGYFSGFIDCGRLGVADGHQDLALATRSIASNLGDAWVGSFLDRYGMAMDPARADFYRLLDEFF